MTQVTVSRIKFDMRVNSLCLGLCLLAVSLSFFDVRFGKKQALWQKFAVGLLFFKFATIFISLKSEVN